MSNKRNPRNTRIKRRSRAGGKRNPPGSKLRRRFREGREATGRDYSRLVPDVRYGRRSER